MNESKLSPMTFDGMTGPTLVGFTVMAFVSLPAVTTRQPWGTHARVWRQLGGSGNGDCRLGAQAARRHRRVTLFGLVRTSPAGNQSPKFDVSS